MCNTDTMQRCLQPDFLSPPCDARSSRKDASSSFTDLGTMFVATMVDTKDIMDQLQAIFCYEIWPAFCAEIANCRSRVIELETYVDESRRHCEERERLEMESRQERDAERSRLLGENDLLRTELEQEKVKCNSAVQEAAQRSLHQAEGVEKKGMKDENPKFVQEDQALQQRFLEENLKQEKRKCQSLADELERLQEASKVSETKTLLLQEENQRLTRMRPVSEKAQALDKRRRLSLKKPEKLPMNNSSNFSLVGKGEEPAHFVSCDEPQGSDTKDCVQYVCNLQRQQSLQGCINQVDKGSDFPASDLPPSDRGTKKQLQGTSADMEGAIIIDLPAAAESVERPLVEPICQGGLANELESAAVLEVEVECFQRPRAGAVTHPGPHGLVDSDETVMEAVDQRNFVPDIAQEFPVISISTENQAAPYDEPFQPASRMVITNEAVLSGTVERNVDNRNFAQTGASLVSNPTRLPSGRPTSVSHKLVSKCKDHPWRQTRSRAEPCEGDPHDSFLDTPREKALAKLAATSREQARSADSLAVQQEVGIVQVKTDELWGDGLKAELGARVGQEAAARKDHSSASSRLLDGQSYTGVHDRTRKNGGTSKAPPAYKFNEPVRKKRDREALQATDCKQCKKFYDAVEAGDGAGAMLSRCEHHDAVSRHRYRYLPPATPEGFWNIGFDDSYSRD